MTDQPGEFGSALLVLPDGRIFPGRSFGASGSMVGELAITAGGPGFQQLATTPAHRNRIVVATAPQIGNTGWAEEHGSESAAVHIGGLVCRELSPIATHHRATGSLADALTAAAV